MIMLMAVEKITISLDPELAASIRAEAEAAGTSVSAWITRSLQRERRRKAFFEALADWESEYGPITPEELAAARRRLEPS
jgi:hypothetical protein